MGRQANIARESDRTANFLEGFETVEPPECHIGAYLKLAADPRERG